MSGTNSSPHGDLERKNEVSEQQQAEALKTCLDTLFYEDGSFRPITLHSLELLKDAKKHLDEANTLFIAGILPLLGGRLSAKHLIEAEEKGCDHPILYCLLGECYKVGQAGIAKDDTKAMEYYDKAIEGGCTWAYSAAYGSKRDCEEGKTLNHLLEVESRSTTDYLVLEMIGDGYQVGYQGKHDPSMAAKYYQRAIDAGSAIAYAKLAKLLWYKTPSDPADRQMGVLKILEAEEKGIALKDDRILSDLVEWLIRPRYVPITEVPAHFKDAEEMALHYCDLLIKRRSPLGYYHKGSLYWEDHPTMSKDKSKAVAIWEEADQAGLADAPTYFKLAKAFLNTSGIPADGLKVLEYCEKTLRCRISSARVFRVFESMGDVYSRGISPVSQDGTLAISHYESALQHTTQLVDKMALWRKMADVYRRGVPPLAPDLTKADELRERANGQNR